MQLSDFDFELPDALIAQRPAEPRDHSRLMVVSTEIHHHHFYDLPDFLKAGDVVVMNDTRVINARLFGVKSTGGAVEILLLYHQFDMEWLALIRPSKRVRVGDIIRISDCLSVEILQKNAVVTDDESAPMHRVRLRCDGDWAAVLDEVGQIPLPPYIRGGRAEAVDQTRYQTVIADKPGAVAAPTAGLHFTSDLLFKLREKGVLISTITLHVGYGTFKPISVSDITQHAMHVEHYEVPPETADSVTLAKREGRRVIAVGTTATRCLESAWTGNDLRSGPGATSIYMYPGYRFGVIDGLITNFHLPKSSLLVLVSAFLGRDTVAAAYGEAIRNRYRFYSYGDAMLLWPSQK